MTTYGLFIYERAEELDFVGPWEVFQSSSARRGHADTVVLIAEHAGPIRCNKGMRVLPDHTLDDHPPLDVLLIPGGADDRLDAEAAKPIVTEWIRRTAAGAEWVTTVCDGA